jgi:Peptidase family M48
MTITLQKALTNIVARRILAGVCLLGTMLVPQHKAKAATVASHLDVQIQTACEAQMLGQMDAREVFSGETHDVLAVVARAYGRRIPHVYILPDSWNMAYIAGSTVVDGRGKIVVGARAIELFDNNALKGFLGHEMAHLVSDTGAQGCNDYIVRDPQTEADADALAARILGKRSVKAFLERVLVLTENQNWDARHRLEMLG